MIWVGLLIVVLAFVAIIKNYETRLVLITAGVLMCVLAAIGAAFGWLNLSYTYNKVAYEGASAVFYGGFDKFIGALISSSLVPAICVCMGFAAIMDYTKCSESLVNLLTAPLHKVRALVVPGAVIITWVINIVIQSASGCAATVGTLLIPMMIGLGVNPAVAAAAVLIGTWGNAMNPAGAFVVQVANIAKEVNPDSNVNGGTVVGSYMWQAILILVISAALLTVIDIIINRKKTAGANTGAAVRNDGERNIIKAIIPFLPLVLVILSVRGVLPNMDVAVWMLIGSVIGLLVDVKHVQDTIKQFFKGMGDGYREIITLMAAASIFAYGMTAIGLVGALTDLMKNSTAIAKLSAAVGPFMLAFVTGSGNAATTAFNQSVTIHAQDMGFTVESMGSIAVLAGCLGRDCSPVAGVTIIVAKMAGVEPMKIVKYAIIPMVVAMALFLILL